MGLTTIGEIIKQSLRDFKNEKTESPIEDYFMNHIYNLLHDAVELIPQYKVSAMGMNFRLDFLLQLGDKKVAVECDGKEFHNPARDLWRDAVILGENKVDVIYRFRGADLHSYIQQCMYIIYLHEKDLFSKEGAGLIMLPMESYFLRQQPNMLKEDIAVNPLPNHSTMYANRRTKLTPKSRHIYASCEGLTATSIEDLAQQVKKKLSK